MKIINLIRTVIIIIASIISINLFGQGSFFGTTSIGGNNNNGVFFEYNLASNSIINKIDFNSINDGSSPCGKPLLYNSKLYGMTTNGGASNVGIIYEYDPSQNILLKLFSFNTQTLNGSGSLPKGSLTLFNNKFYGLTSSSGNAGSMGTLFEFDPATNVFTKLVDFSTTYGFFPEGTLLVIGTKLYGSTQTGGLNGYGTLFSYEPSTSIFTTLVNFDAINGNIGSGSLAIFNNNLFGYTTAGGLYNKGTLFEYDIANNLFNSRFSFDGINSGENPAGNGLKLIGSTFYGLCSNGGLNNFGTLFEFNPVTFVFSKKADFDNLLGQFPRGELEVFGTSLFGLASNSGANFKGSMFKFNLTNDIISVEFNFDIPSGSIPTGSLLYCSFGNPQTFQSWSNMTIPYGDMPMVLTATSNSGLPIEYTSSNPSIADVSGGVLTVYTVGIVTITATDYGNYLYNRIDSIIQLTVTKRPLTVTPLNVERCPSDPNPTFTLVYSGFAAGEDQSDLDVLPSAMSMGTTTSGTFPIIASNGNDNHYSFQYIDGLLTISGTMISSNIIGKDIIKNNSVTSYYINPILSSYSYNWSYTGQGLKFIGDSISSSINVYANKNVTSGNLLCIIEQCGLIDTLIKSIVINEIVNSKFSLSPLTCEVTASNCDSTYIVSLNIDNIFETPTTGCSNSGYSDYTDLEVINSLFVGESYSLNLIGGGFPSYYGIWIDYNNDGDFNDAMEMVSANFDVGFQYIVPNIIIPNNEMVLGPKRLRIRSRLTGPFNSFESCPDSSINGETEDYLVYFDSRPSLEAPNFISPNNDGWNDLFIIKGIDLKKSNKLLILNNMGQVIYEAENYQNNWPSTVGLSELKPGVLYYIFKNGENELKSYIELSY